MARATGKSEAVYERLKGDIESLRLRPGAKLGEVQTPSWSSTMPKRLRRPR